MLRRLLLLSVVAVAGCSTSATPQADDAPSPAATPAAVQLAHKCAPAPSPAFSWPEQVPPDLPTPPGARLTDVQKRADGLTVVMFSTPTSIRESVLFVIEALPAAGYTLARGDAENTEADAPFSKGNLRGVLRMIAVEQCRTDWLMAVTSSPPAGGAGSPLLPTRPDASPLPFG